MTCPLQTDRDAFYCYRRDIITQVILYEGSESCKNNSNNNNNNKGIKKYSFDN